MSNAAPELPPELPPRVADSRKTPRERVVLPGMVLYGEGAFSINCRISEPPPPCEQRTRHPTRAALPAHVRQLHTNYHIPISNTAAGLMLMAA